jgi:hypothetical protein
MTKIFLLVLGALALSISAQALDNGCQTVNPGPVSCGDWSCGGGCEVGTTVDAEGITWEQCQCNGRDPECCDLRVTVGITPSAIETTGHCGGDCPEGQCVIEDIPGDTFAECQVDPIGGGGV